MTRDSREMQLMLRHYRLTTAEILYHFPDHPALLQSYVWQELDLAPKFPCLKKFLDFWEREVMHAEAIAPHEFHLVKAPLVIH